MINLETWISNFTVISQNCLELDVLRAHSQIPVYTWLDGPWVTSRQRRERDFAGKILE